MENDFLAMKKFCPWLKSHFPSISQANMYFFRLGQNFLSAIENIMSDRKYLHSMKHLKRVFYALSICLDKDFFPMLKKYVFACEMDGK